MLIGVNHSMIYKIVFKSYIEVLKIDDASKKAMIDYWVVDSLIC